MKKNITKVYCKFNKDKQPVEEVVCNIFRDHIEKVKFEKLSKNDNYKDILNKKN